jgi:hypothetical protein
MDQRNAYEEMRMSAAARVSLHIDRLVMRGIDPTTQQAFARSLKTELARVLGDSRVRAAMSHNRRTPVMRLGQLPMQPGVAGASKLAVSVARAIGRGMKA